MNSDWWVCMPEPFSPNSGFGMNVAYTPLACATSLTMLRYVMQWSAIVRASA